MFLLGVNNLSPCYPISYRVGNCCNQTLDAVSLSMDTSECLFALIAIIPEKYPLLFLSICIVMSHPTGMQSAFQYAKVYTSDGTAMPGAVGSINEYGVQVQLPAMLYVDSIPVDQFYS